MLGLAEGPADYVSRVLISNLIVLNSLRQQLPDLFQSVHRPDPYSSSPIIDDQYAILLLSAQSQDNDHVALLKDGDCCIITQGALLERWL